MMNDEFELDIPGYDIKRVQKAILSIALEIDRICRKHNIKYSLEGGSMLGAYKYKGYVPWDDDMDIVMLRKDYDAFLNIVSSEIDTEKFYVQNYHNRSQYPLTWTKVCLNGTEIFGGNYNELDIHHGLFVDLFPIDNVILKKINLQKSLVGVTKSARFIKLGLMKPKGIKGRLQQAVSLLPISVINRLGEAAMRMNNKKQCEYAYEICNPNKKFPPLPKCYFENLVEMEFEGHMFYVSKNYMEYLESRFGDLSKEPPIEERYPSHGTDIVFY